MSGQQSLRKYAAEKQREAADAARLARLAMNAANWLDGAAHPTFRKPFHPAAGDT